MMDVSAGSEYSYHVHGKGASGSGSWLMLPSRSWMRRFVIL